VAKLRRDEKGRPYRSHKDVLADEMKEPHFQEAYRKRSYIHAIAMAVRSMRERAGMSQTQLAALVGMKQPAIARIETSQTNTPQWQTVDRIAAALHQQLDLRLGAVKEGQPLVRIRAGREPSRSHSHG
jgi:DNA-binding XRE family transcriptional regulator